MSTSFAQHHTNRADTIVPTPLALDNAFDVACLFKLEEAGLFNVFELTFSEWRLRCRIRNRRAPTVATAL